LAAALTATALAAAALAAARAAVALAAATLTRGLDHFSAAPRGSTLGSTTTRTMGGSGGQGRGRVPM